MNYYSAIIFLLLLVTIAYLVYRYATQEVLVERGGEIRTVRKFVPTPKFIFGVVISVVVYLIILSIRFIPQGNAGVKFNSLFRTYSIVREGTVFMMPLFENVYLYDLKVRKVTVGRVKGKKGGTLWGTSRDGISVGIEAAMWYKLIPESLMTVHRNFGPDYEDQFIRTTFIGAIKYVMSKYTAEDLISFSQHGVERDLKDYIKEKIEPSGFSLLDAAIEDIKLSPDYEKVLEDRRIEEQKVLNLKYTIKQESLKVQKMIVEAKGKAEALSIIGEVIRKNPKILTYMYIDKLGDKIKVLVTDQKNLLNIEKLEK